MFKKWFLLTNPTSGSILENSFKWYHIPTHGISTCDIYHARWWFHKWSSTLSDQIKKCYPHLLVVSLVDWTMLWHRGRCPTDWYQGKRSYVVSQKWCHPNIDVNVHQICKIRVSTIYPNASLCINKKHTFFWKLMTKGERLDKDMQDFLWGICKISFGGVIVLGRDR
jgi:hypothetical protein